MPTSNFNQGNEGFTLRVNSNFVDEIPFYEGCGDAKTSIFIELDLNPSSKMFEKDEKIFDANYLSEVFKFMAVYVKNLADPQVQAANSKLKDADVTRISKILLNKNSPSTALISFAYSYNGDVMPPRKPAAN